jgi:predicted unusual protein kinase regulating ubiquinone biosynthesis (AarF/ABC1/UbiB family)
MRPRRYKDALEDIITVPYVYPNMTTSKVLVMDWMAGVRLTDTQALTALNLPKKKLIDSLVQVRVAEIQYP